MENKGVILKYTKLIKYDRVITNVITNQGSTWISFHYRVAWNNNVKSMPMCTNDGWVKASRENEYLYALDDAQKSAG